MPPTNDPKTNLSPSASPASGPLAAAPGAAAVASPAAPAASSPSAAPSGQVPDAARPALPRLGGPGLPLPPKLKMLRTPYLHPSEDRDHPGHACTISFRDEKGNCWSATGIYLGVDDVTPPGETLIDLAEELKAQEAAALASQKAGLAHAAAAKAAPKKAVVPPPPPAK